MATDYKIALECIQESAGSENAKLKVYKSDGTTVVLAEKEITSTDASNPTIAIFEVTGMDDPSSTEYQSLVLELTNEYYVDSSTDRNIVVVGMKYVTKDGSNYVHMESGSGLANTATNTTDSDVGKWLRTQITGISGNDVDADAYATGEYVTVWSGSKVTITFPTKYASNVVTGYPYNNSGTVQS